MSVMSVAGKNPFKKWLLFLDHLINLGIELRAQ